MQNGFDIVSLKLPYMGMNTLPSRLFLAPMAELSTPALRHIIKEMCAEVVLCSEMLSAGAIAAGAAHNEPLVRKHEFDDPLIYQIVGSDPDVMAEAAAILSEQGCFAVDINMGCPNYDIVKKNQGARLLTDIEKAKKIVRACRRKTPVKLSVKMRTGYESNDEKEFIKFIAMLEGEGIDFITVHPRYARLSFKRQADWRLVALAKKHVSIPVIGNGDIDHPAQVLEKMRDTGCDGVMIGREAVKSPWIFKLAADLLAGREAVMEVNVRDIFITALQYMALHLPERLHKSRSHRFSFYFSKNAIYGHDLFTRIRKERSIDRIQDIVIDYYSRNGREAVKSFRGEPPHDREPL